MQIRARELERRAPNYDKPFDSRRSASISARRGCAKRKDCVKSRDCDEHTAGEPGGAPTSGDLNPLDEQLALPQNEQMGDSHSFNPFVPGAESLTRPHSLHPCHRKASQVRLGSIVQQGCLAADKDKVGDDHLFDPTEASKPSTRLL